MTGSANNQWLKATNAELVLNLLRSGPLSKTEISQELKLPSSTVTYTVSRLNELGIVIELAAKKENGGVSDRGRKRTQIALNENFGRIAGLELKANSCRITIVGIGGSVILQKEIRFSISEPIGSAEERFCRVVEYCVDYVKRTCEPLPLLGVGISIPGIVIDEKGLVRNCWTHSLKNSDFIHFFSSFDIPIVLENDANAAAMSRLKSGMKDYIYLLVSSHFDEDALPDDVPPIGIGMGIVIDGQLYRGSCGSAGEYRSSMLMGNPLEEGQVSLSREALMQMINDEDVALKFARQVFNDVLSIASVLDPRMIYLGGMLSEDELMKGVAEKILREKLKDSGPAVARIASVMAFPHASAYDCSMGAALLMVEKMYTLPKIGKSLDEASNKMMEIIISGP